MVGFTSGFLFRLCEPWKGVKMFLPRLAWDSGEMKAWNVLIGRDGIGV